jgi:hypothetical protein
MIYQIWKTKLFYIQFSEALLDSPKIPDDTIVARCS